MSTIALLVIGRLFATPSKEGEKYHIALSRFRSKANAPTAGAISNAHSFN